MRSITIPLEPAPAYGVGWWTSAHVLVVDGRRHAIHFCDETGVGRREAGGVDVPGPWAFLSDLSAYVLDVDELAARVDAGLDHRATIGDRVRCDGVVFEINLDETNQPTLELTGRVPALC